MHVKLVMILNSPDDLEKRGEARHIVCFLHGREQVVHCFQIA